MVISSRLSTSCIVRTVLWSSLLLMAWWQMDMLRKRKEVSVLPSGSAILANFTTLQDLSYLFLHM